MSAPPQTAPGADPASPSLAALAERLVPLDRLPPHEPVDVVLAYARADHPDNVFGIAVYPCDARLWLVEDLAAVVLLAARRLQHSHGWRLDVLDGLRPVEAQAAMAACPFVAARPWLLEGPPVLLSRPGQGGHPRAMAVDVAPRDAAGARVAMGTGFDAFDLDPDGRAYADRACRRWPGVGTAQTQTILANRAALEAAMVGAAADLGVPLWPLPAEWWDFRLPPKISERWPAWCGPWPSPTPDQELARVAQVLERLAPLS